MINQNKFIWVPKKIRDLFYKDIDFNIQNYVLNKDIHDIPGNGYLIKKAIFAKNIFYSLLVLFVILTLPIVAFFIFHICILAGVNISFKEQIIYIFGITAGVLWLLGWIILFINIFTVGIFYVNKQIKNIIEYFNKLVKENKLVSDIKKYPIVFIMAFYSKNRSQFPIDYPNTFPRFSPFFALIGPCIFFDKLYYYINKK